MTTIIPDKYNTALGGNDDVLEDRFRNIDFRRQRDPNRSRSVPPPQRHFVPRNSYDELDSHSRFVDQNNLQPTHSNMRGDEIRAPCPPCYPQGFEGFGEYVEPTRSFVQPLSPPPPRTNPPASWWNPETHQFETHNFMTTPPPSGRISDGGQTQHSQRRLHKKSREKERRR